MATRELKVQNVKCGGCASAIQTGLKDMAGIDSVEVEVASGTVTLEGSSLPADEAVAAKLAELGYPVAE